MPERLGCKRWVAQCLRRSHARPQRGTAHRHYCLIQALLPIERESAMAIDAELFGDVLPT
jgi:hypothetical protein